MDDKKASGSSKGAGSKVTPKVLRLNPDEQIKFWLGNKYFRMTRKEAHEFLKTKAAQELIAKSQQPIEQTIEWVGDDGSENE